MAVDLQYDFSDKQALVISSGASAVSTNVNYDATTPEDAFGVSKSMEIGGSFFIVEVTTALVGATVLTAELTTKAADASISSGGTVIAAMDFAATAAAGTVKQFVLGPGTERLAYLGVVYKSTGAKLTAGAVNARIGTAAAVTD